MYTSIVSTRKHTPVETFLSMRAWWGMERAWEEVTGSRHGCTSYPACPDTGSSGKVESHVGNTLLLPELDFELSFKHTDAKCLSLTRRRVHTKKVGYTQCFFDSQPKIWPILANFNKFDFEIDLYRQENLRSVEGRKEGEKLS